MSIEPSPFLPQTTIAIEKIKDKDPEMVDNINKIKNQILYNNKLDEI